MNADLNTLMMLMSVLGGKNRETGSTNMLPLIAEMLKNRTPPPSADDGQKTGGRGLADMLPLLMGMMKGGMSAPSAAPEAAPTPMPEAPPVRRYAETPFVGIAFAGAEVRSFMETLWRVRKRV